MKIHYAPEAVDDLIRLREFIEVKNPYAAKRVAAKILAGVAKLKAFPKIGLMVQRSSESNKIRDLYVSNYTVRYLLRKDTVYILRIWHGKEIEKDL